MSFWATSHPPAHLLLPRYTRSMPACLIPASGLWLPATLFRLHILLPASHCLLCICLACRNPLDEAKVLRNYNYDSNRVAAMYLLAAQYLTWSLTHATDRLSFARVAMLLSTGIWFTREQYNRLKVFCFWPPVFTVNAGAKESEFDNSWVLLFCSPPSQTVPTAQICKAWN